MHVDALDAAATLARVVHGAITEALRCVVDVRKIPVTLLQIRHHVGSVLAAQLQLSASRQKKTKKEEEPKEERASNACFLSFLSPLVHE
eukprot:scaffold358_cov256-Pinguiococcus_pyrenoidosus.AAC.8